MQRRTMESHVLVTRSDGLHASFDGTKHAVMYVVARDEQLQQHVGTLEKEVTVPRHGGRSPACSDELRTSLRCRDAIDWRLLID